MKVLFIVIGVVVIFGLLINSGALSGEVCIGNVGCVRTTEGGLTVQGDDSGQISPRP